MSVVQSQREGVTVFSIDAIALYLEIDVLEEAKVTRRAIEHSKTLYDRLTMDWLAGKWS